MAAKSLVSLLSAMTLSGSPPFAAPFTLVVGKDKWAVATDRSWVIAVRGSWSLPVWEASEARITRARTIVATAPTKAALSVPLAALLAWARPEEERQRPGRLAGVLVDTCRVARILDGLPFTRVLVWDATEAIGTPCVAMAAGNRWRAFLAGMLADEEAVPPFDPNAQHSVFDALMDS